MLFQYHYLFIRFSCDQIILFTSYIKVRRGGANFGILLRQQYLEKKCVFSKGSDIYANHADRWECTLVRRTILVGKSRATLRSRNIYKYFAARRMPHGFTVFSRACGHMGHNIMHENYDIKYCLFGITNVASMLWYRRPVIEHVKGLCAIISSKKIGPRMNAVVISHQEVNFADVD